MNGPKEVARMDAPAVLVIDRVRSVLSCYMFLATSESTVRDQAAKALTRAGISVEPEVPEGRNRYDLVVQVEGVRLVLEMKLRAAPAPVERQAQRYAMMDSVHGVAVVTTSSRLAHALADMTSLGGKPFGVIILRTSS